MGLLMLEESLENVKQRTDELFFADLIREARDALGLKQYRAAEFLGICNARLKNLETGYFRDMPTVDEINAFAALYDLPTSLLYDKAKEHVQRRKKDRKVRTIQDARDMQRMSAHA